MGQWPGLRPFSGERVPAGGFYLVAHALAAGYTVVTHEKPGGGSIKKVQIPDVCIGLGVKCVTPFEMLRAERARFVLPSRGQSLPASQPT